MNNLFTLILAGTALGWPGLTPALAAVLTNVPMQGGMVMPMVSYSAAEGALRVQVDPTVPELTPLLASNPGDHFDAADPWHDALDPSRQGLAFSRRDGFVMDTATDPLPDGTAIWIRKLSSAPEPGFHRYRSTPPKAWEPIFGTEGSTNAILWNGMMFHPAVTAPTGTNSYAAAFEAFLVSTTTGATVPGSSSGPFTLRWTSVPDGRPALCIAQKVVIAWPDQAVDYVLECADSLTASNWSTVTNATVLVDGQPSVILNSGEAKRFFRMRLVE